jgi:hypothetical protein
VSGDREQCKFRTGYSYLRLTVQTVVISNSFVRRPVVTVFESVNHHRQQGEWETVGAESAAAFKIEAGIAMVGGVEVHAVSSLCNNSPFP